MTDANKTAIALIVDRSGSMGSIRVEAENSINTFLEEQSALPGELLVEIVQFDDNYEVVKSLSSGRAKKFTLTPRGMTALHDAMGRTINRLGDRLRKMPENERPGKVLVVTVTDGMENASQEYTADKVKELVTEQTDKYGWDFVFLAANQDAVLTAQGLGIKRDSSLTFDPNLIAVAASATSNYATSYRSGLVASFTDSDRDAASKS